MTISLAFLAPNLVKAAVEGRLPRGDRVFSAKFDRTAPVIRMFCANEIARSLFPLADLDALVSAPDIVTVAERTNRAIGDTATTLRAWTVRQTEGEANAGSVVQR